MPTTNDLKKKFRKKRMAIKEYSEKEKELHQYYYKVLDHLLKVRDKNIDEKKTKQLNTLKKGVNY